MSPITTHVLDTSLGQPAQNLAIQLERWQGEGWQPLASGVTNPDGRIVDLLTREEWSAGRYRMTFAVADYLEAQGVEAYFYPQVQIEFLVQNPTQHYHVPLLLSPFGYSTYRGS